MQLPHNTSRNPLPGGGPTPSGPRLSGFSESPSTGRVGKVKKAFRGGVVSVVRIPMRSDLSVHDSIYKRV